MNNDFKGIYINGDTYMTKNIPREIIKAFSCIDNELSVCSDDLPKILDYIHNLQEETKEADEAVEYWQEECDNLQQRIDKAVEYIEKDLKEEGK